MIDVMYANCLTEGNNEKQKKK